MEIVRDHATSFAEKQVVVSARPEAGDDVDVVISSEVLVNSVQILDHPDIHPCHLVGVVASEEPVHRAKRIGIAMPVARAGQGRYYI